MLNQPNILQQRRAIDALLKAPAFYSLSCSILLLLFQVASGTNIGYAFLVFLFINVSAATVIALGGPGRLIGLCVTVLALQHVVVSQIAKVCFWQPGDSVLKQPMVTMGVYVVGMTGLLIASLVSNRLRIRTSKPLFVAIIAPHQLLWMAIICTVAATARTLILAMFGVNADSGEATVGGLLGPLRQLTFLDPLAIASATAYTILSSRWRNSFGILNAVAMLVPLLFGALGAQRSSMVLPVITYLITCMAFHYKFKFVHYSIFLSIAYMAQFVLFPYALLARSIVRTPSVVDNVRLATGLLGDILSDPISFQEKYQEQTRKEEANLGAARKGFWYYGRSIPTLDRYSVIIWADGVIDGTLNRGTTGMETILPGFQMVIPRFLNSDKPIVGTSPLLAHQAFGLINKKDHTTGITLGFFADAFSSYEWLGVAVISFLIGICFFTVYRTIIDDHLRSNVYAISLAFIWPWNFSEGTIQALIINIVATSVVIILTLWIVKHLVNFITSFSEQRILLTQSPHQTSVALSSKAPL